MAAIEDSAVDKERAAWLRRRVRLLSAGFLVTFGLAYALTERAMFGDASTAAWLHLPQAAVLTVHWLWLRRPRARRVVEWGTVVAWCLCLGWSSLWLVFSAAGSVPAYALALLITVMFAAPTARLSWRAMAAMLLAAAVAVLVCAVVRYGGAPPLLVIKNALLTIPGIALVLDAASRDRLERAEFDARTRLQLANLSLQREEEARTRLFVNLSHDFRTPLTLIRGEAEWLHARSRATDETGALARIEAHSSALADLIEQLLELARLDAGKTPRREVDFSVDAVATDVAAQLRPGTGSIRVEVEGGDPPAMARADRNHVRRILFNLVSNGVRELRDRGGLILIRSARAGAEVIVDVVDDGPGIPAERRAGLFDRFTSLSSGGSTVSGIGLPLARELALLNRGMLELLDGAPRTTFRLRLPSGEGNAVTSGDALAQPLPPIDGEPDAAGVDGRPYLLVVEDHPDMRGLLRRVLGDRFRVRTAASVEEAIRALGEEVPRAVVSDVLLGERTGYDLLAFARRRPALESVPVLLVSALSDTEQRVRGLAAGADDYLAKPFSTDELRARVTAAVDRADARQAALRAQRDAILMELHDGVNGALARAAILLASRRPVDESRVDAAAAVAEALDESTALLSVIEAAPVPWDELCAELRRHLADTCERHGLTLRFAVDDDGSCDRLRPAAGHALRRITREALTNVVKHARARTVECQLSCAAGVVSLRLADDGVGFPPGAPLGRGMGIIARRSEQLGGGADFTPRQGGGAVVAARLPG